MPKHTLIVTAEFPPLPGGIGAHAEQMGRALHRAGLGLRVLTPAKAAADVDVQKFRATLPFPVENLVGRGMSLLGRWRWESQIAHWCQVERPDCLIGTGRRALWVTGAVARRQGLPWIAFCHGSELLDVRPRRLRRTETFCREAAQVIANSAFVARLSVRAGISPDRVRVINPGAGCAGAAFPRESADAIRQRLGLNGYRVILTVGHVSRRKAQDVVIRAMPEILQSVPDAVYVIAGMPNEQPAFHALACALGVADRVRFLGVVPSADLPALYRACDLFILNSRVDEAGNCEGFGMVLIEAGLAGRPVIGTHGAGIEDAIQDGVTGLLVPPDSPESTARAVIRLLLNRDLAQELGQAGRKRAKEEFSWDHLVEPITHLMDST